MKPTPTTPQHHSQSGYGFGIILALVVLLSAGSFILSKGTENALKKDQRILRTQTTMNRVIEAIDAYADGNSGNLPCPAARNVPISSDTFGEAEEFTVGSPNTSCIGSNTRTATTDSSAGAAPQIRIGAVPTATLGLSQEDAFDDWGNRFTFAIIEDFGDGFSGFAFDPTQYYIEVTTDGSAAHPNISAATKTAIGYVLISHGENGHGAWTRADSQRSGCTVARALERENCDDDYIFVSAPHSGKNAADADLFDDIVRWKMFN